MNGRAQSGFTLIELAVAMFIIALLLGGVITTLSARQSISNTADTKQLLNDAREVIIGFAVATGRLPCPSRKIDQGRESPASGGTCISSDGFLPAETLGIGPRRDGFLIDAWGNEIRYAVTDIDGYAFTTAGKIRATMTSVSTDYVKVDGANAVLVVYSVGKDGAIQATTDGGKAFTIAAPNSDDTLVELSPYSLYSRLSLARAL